MKKRLIQNVYLPLIVFDPRPCTSLLALQVVDEYGDIIEVDNSTAIAISIGLKNTADRLSF